MPVTTLLLFSGGLDSTTMLLKMLIEKQPVHVYECSYRNGGDRYLAEELARFLILKDMKENGLEPSGRSRTDHDFESISNFYLPDQHILLFYAGLMCRTIPGITQIAVGTCADDSRNDRNRVRMDEAKDILASLSPVPVIQPVKHMSKSDEVAYIKQHMPKLLDRIHYCRGPIWHQTIGWANCELCRACQWMKEADPEVYQRKVKG